MNNKMMTDLGGHPMAVRLLQEADAEIYQQVRLHGLRTNPEAFGSTYEREIAFPLESVQQRIKPTADKFVLGAFDETGKLGGIVTFVRESGMKMAHKGNVFGMYVDATMRGRGLGRDLLVALLQRALLLEGLEQINLTVVSTNSVAKKLYASLGFRVYGSEHNALKYNGTYFDEDLMVLRLDSIHGILTDTRPERSY